MDTNALITAACLILEAGGEGTKGMESVLEVVHTRAQALTLGAVVLQRKQFSAFNGISWQEAVARARRHARWDEALKLASEPVKTDWTRGADHYCTTRISPYWAKGRTPVAVIGNHKFYRLKE